VPVFLKHSVYTSIHMLGLSVRPKPRLLFWLGQSEPSILSFSNQSKRIRHIYRKGHNEERPITLQPQCIVKMQLSWYWVGHSGGYWQQAELWCKRCEPKNDVDEYTYIFIFQRQQNDE